LSTLNGKGKKNDCITVYFVRFTLNPFFYSFRKISNGQQTECEKEKKIKVARLMAERCASNEIQTAYAAAKYPECIELSVTERQIQYYLDKINPTNTAALAAERAHTLRKDAQKMNAKASSVEFVFVERGGAAAAEEAASKAIKKLAREESKKLKNVIDLAEDEAKIAYQAGLEAGAEEERMQLMEELQIKASKLAALNSESKERESAFRRMERELLCERAKKREAEAEADAANARALAERSRHEEARKKVGALKHKLAYLLRSSEEQAATSPSDEVTWCTVEVEEFERQIGELTAQVREFKKMEREYQRNKSAVDNFKDKYAEISSLRSENRAYQQELARIEAERGRVEEEVKAHMSTFLPGSTRAVPLYSIRKANPGARTSQYFEYFAGVIRPAMLDTGASPDQINRILRKQKTFYSPPAPFVCATIRQLFHLIPCFTTAFHLLFSGLNELQYYEPFQSPSELPSADWWLTGIELGAVYAKCYGWTLIAKACRLVQAGFDETKIAGNAASVS
jgi:hypothetical protein